MEITVIITTSITTTMIQTMKVHIEVKDIICKNFASKDNHKLVKKFSTVFTLHYVV
uniref:Uncharacterized protein n=1 Tax=Populus trichocarpa TaxID=3694 RepID=A0A2K1ZPN9_POPTR